MTGKLIRFLGAAAVALAAASVVPMVVGPVRAQTPVAFGTYRPTGPSIRPTFPVYTPDPNRPIELIFNPGNINARYFLLPTTVIAHGAYGFPSQSLFRTPLRPIQFQGFVFNNQNQGGNQGNNQGGFGGGGIQGGGGFGGGGLQGGFGGGGFGGGGLGGGFGGGGIGGGGIGGIGGGGIGGIGGGIGGIGGGQTQLFPQFPQRSFGGYNAIGITQYQTTQNIPPGLLSGGGGGLGGIGGGLGGFGGGLQGGFGGGQFGGGFGGGQFGGGQFGGGQFGGGQFGGGKIGFGGTPAL